MPPSMHDGMDALAPAPHAPSAAAAHHASSSRKRRASDDAATTAALYGDLPENKRRKFILVDDAQRQNRVRVRVTLDQVLLDEMPDSYRRANSVFPRAYFPMQMQSPSAAPSDPRFRGEGAPEATDRGGGDEGCARAQAAARGRAGEGEDTESATVGRTTVPVPLLEGGGRDIALPRISRAKRKREKTLNELGYRMSWSQSRVFAGRMLFLQKSRTSFFPLLQSSALPVPIRSRSVLLLSHRAH